MHVRPAVTSKITAFPFVKIFIYLIFNPYPAKGENMVSS
jgi:hypothetical protein